MENAQTVSGSDFMIPLPKPTTPQPVADTPIQNSDTVPENEIKRAVMVDRKGNPFDPERHINKVHPNTGVWMPRNRSRKPESSEIPNTTNPPPPEPSFVAPPSGQAETESDKESQKQPFPGGTKGAAKTATAITHLAFIKAFGKEGMFNEEENAMIAESWTNFFEIREYKLSPEWAIVAAIGSVFADRMTKPCGISFIQRIKNKIRDWKETAAARRAVRHVRKSQKRAHEKGMFDDGNPTTGTGDASHPE